MTEPSVDRTTRRLAIAALVLAILAVGLASWRLLVPGTSPCQSTAWSALPAAADLPTGWTIRSTQYQPEQLSLTLAGPQPADQTTAQAVIYTTVSCYASDAVGAVTRSQAAAAASGMTVAARTDLGDQAYAATEAASGSIFIQFRRGNVVTYLAASGDATADDVNAVADALDQALGGTGTTGAITIPSSSDAGPSGSPDPLGTPLPSGEPTPAASVAAPELEAALPTTVGSTTLTINSGTGSTVLGTDPGSRAIVAALRTAGIATDAFRVAQAYDEAGTTDLSITAFRVEGVGSDIVQPIVLDSWLSATGSGVTRTSTTVGGRSVTKVDYGDGGGTPLVLVDGDILFVIETSDAALAVQAVAALPSGG